MSTTYSFISLREAIYDYLQNFLQPAVNDDCIIYGNQNNIALPAGTNDYIIFYVQSQVRHGTNIEIYDPDAEITTLTENSEVVVRVDCYCDSSNGSDGANAQIRAQNLELVTRSSLACTFLKDYNLSPLYADDASDTTFVGDSDNYLHRWTVNLHFSFRHSYSVSQPGFTEVNPVFPNAFDSTGEESGFHYAEVDTHFKS